MDFKDFLDFVPHLQQLKLPGAEAHFKMAPRGKEDVLRRIQNIPENPRLAAIMMLLYPKDSKTHLVLIVRNSYEGVHSNQIAFPGGKYELEDIDFEQTAKRETHEEVGIHPDKMTILKAFTPTYIPPSNFLVHPFLGLCHDEIQFVPDPKEVAKIIEIPLSIILSDAVLTHIKHGKTEFDQINIPAFNIKNEIVWGATAMILSELKDVLKSVLSPEMKL